MAGEVIAAAERGATHIADRVVAKIASRAACEALPGRPRAASQPGATVAVRGGAARVRVSVELGYPSDIGSQCKAVREQVVRRVRALSGLDVPEVSVQVERLHPAAGTTAGGRVR